MRCGVLHASATKAIGYLDSGKPTHIPGDAGHSISYRTIFGMVLGQSADEIRPTQTQPPSYRKQ